MEPIRGSFFALESGSGQDIHEVSSAVLWKERIPLTAGNISSLVIDTLCD